MYCSCTFKQVNVLRKLKCTLCKQILSNIYLNFIGTKLEYACEILEGCFEREISKLEMAYLESARIFHDEHNLQVDILFPMKQGGNICLLCVNIATDNILQNA